MSVIAALAELRRRPVPQQRLLVGAVLSLALARCALRLPFATVSRAIGLHSGETPECVDADTLAQAAQVGWAVEAVATHLPWESTCLMRALAAAALLRRHRIGATLYLGVARSADAPKELSAHAWLRCGELVLTGAAQRSEFTTIATFASTGRGRRAGARRGRMPIGIGA